MPRKKAPEIKKTVDPNVVGLKAEVISQPITETLEQNYMPYAMSVIVSRAIPEIDGFKPSHRKLLYTMYKMNLLTGGRTNRPTSSARPCVSTRTAMLRSMRPWSVSRRVTARC